MISLPNGCKRSKITVTPKTWKTAPANKKAEAELMAKDWRVYYRFYDPAFKGTKKWGHITEIKGMNGFKEYAVRKEITEELIYNEIEKVDKQGYNPITDTFPVVDCLPDKLEEVGPTTLFILALWKALNLLKVGSDMLSDLRSIIRGLERAAQKIIDKDTMQPYTMLMISQVSRKHLIYCFKQCEQDNPKFSAYRQNKYRTGLLMLFKALLSVEAVGANPVTDIPIRTDWVKKKPKLLTQAERLIIDTNLKSWDYHFWRYMRIFFRSGSRSTELLRLKRDENINLEEQEFTIIVKKKKIYQEEIRPIPDDVLDLWIEVYEETKPGEYLFSTSFKPGPTKQYKDAPDKRWKKYVMNDPGKFDPHGLGWGLGIKKSFYKLKHLNEDTIDALLDIEHAAAAAGHTDTKTTKKHYAVGHEGRKREALKRVEVKF